MAKAKAKAKKKVVKKNPSKKPVKKAAKKVTARPVQAQSAPKKTAVAPVKTKKIDVSGFVTPLDDRIIVQATTNTERMTAGGLYIPDTVHQSVGYNQGLVLSVGRGHRDNKGRLRPMDVKPGDKVLFSQLTGSVLKFDNADLFIIRETEVMGVIS